MSFDGGSVSVQGVQNRLCKNCTHFIPENRQCIAQGRVDVDFVNGNVSPTPDTIDFMRAAIGLCGPDGKLFVQLVRVP